MLQPCIRLATLFGVLGLTVASGGYGGYHEPPIVKVIHKTVHIPKAVPVPKIIHVPKIVPVPKTVAVPHPVHIPVKVPIYKTIKKVIPIPKTIPVPKVKLSHLPKLNKNSSHLFFPQIYLTISSAGSSASAQGELPNIEPPVAQTNSIFSSS